jgi:hypothetical protein
MVEARDDLDLAPEPFARVREERCAGGSIFSATSRFGRSCSAK